MFGTVEQLEDGRWQLRFRRTLRHPPDRVWRAITDPEHLAAWFPTTIDGERAVGARLRFRFPRNEAPPFEGEMLRFEPGSLMELRWGTDIVRLELEPAGEETVLTLLDTLDERGKAARDAAGWHNCLEALEADLHGHADAREKLLDGWSEVHDHYAEAFGPEAATIGPPEGME